MKKSILWLFSLCLLACSFLTSCEKQKATNEELIIGTWKLYSYYRCEGDQKDKVFTEYTGEEHYWIFNQDGSLKFKYGESYSSEEAYWKIESNTLYLISEGFAEPITIKSIDLNKMIFIRTAGEHGEITVEYEFNKQ